MPASDPALLDGNIMLKNDLFSFVSQCYARREMWIVGEKRYQKVMESLTTR